MGGAKQPADAQVDEGTRRQVADDDGRLAEGVEAVVVEGLADTAHDEAVAGEQEAAVVQGPYDHGHLVLPHVADGHTKGCRRIGGGGG